MIPILFSENSTTFTTNGIGRLSSCISCDCVEERNGQFELQMVYPESGVHFSDIGIRKIIVVKPSASGSLQPFRIYKITKPINGKVKILAQHISYDLSKNVCMPFIITASGTACNTTLQALKSNAVESCLFSFWTDVNTVASYTQYTPATIRQRLGGVDGSVLDCFGGEYEWDNWTVKLHKYRGTEKDITLRYGKNITDLEQEENIANTVTGVVPFWINTDKSESVTLTEKVVYAPNASAYSSHLTVPLDLSTEFKEKPTEEQIRNKATIYVNQAGFGLPKVSIQVSFINLADTEEYKDILPLQECSLCDTIKVQFERLGIDATAKIVKTDYDVLREKYNSVDVGSIKSSLATTINDMNASMATTIEATSERVYADVNNDVTDMVDNATAWLTSSGGYVVAVKNNDGSWKELLFMDTNDIDTAINVLRINENGLGFSKTGVGGPYYQGWTLDGKILIGGSNASGLTVYKYANNTSQILFQIYSDNNGQAYITWDTEKSSMDADGLLTAVNMVLTGGTLTLGKDNDGEIYMYDSYENLRGQWTKNNFKLFDDDGKTLFQADDEGAKICGEVDLNLDSDNRIRLRDYNGNAVIYFNGEYGNSYIDGTGSGSDGGINLNADRVVFSVDDLGVTRGRGDSTIRNGYSGEVITDLSTDTLTVVTGIDGSWVDLVTFEYVSGYSVHETVNGLVVE